MDSELLVHSQWSVCFWACGRAVYFGGKCTAKETASLLVAGKQREKIDYYFASLSSFCKETSHLSTLF